MNSNNLDRIAEYNPIVSELKEDLMQFDSPLAGGDGDGVFELTDIDSQQLSQKFSHLSNLNPDQSRHLLKLGETISKIREEIKLPPLNSHQISPGEILNTFRTLFGDDFASLAEKTDSAKVRILGDSLTRGMVSISDGGVGDSANYLMAKILLDAMGIPLEESLALIQKTAFPYDRSSIDDPGMMGFAEMGIDQAMSLIFSTGDRGDFFPLSADDQTQSEIDKLIESTERLTPSEKRDRIRSSSALAIGASASTTSDVLSDLNDQSDQAASTGRSFIESNHADIYEDLGSASVFDLMMDSFIEKKPSNELGIFLMMLGANDLFTIGGKKRIVNAVEQNPILFRKHIQEVGRRVSESELGPNFRPIFAAPFDVSAVLVPVPKGTKFSDGQLIPQGSQVLYHHQLIASEEGILPEQVVFNDQDIAKMKKWQSEYYQILQEELGLKHGWQVLDLQSIFSNLVSEIQSKPMSVYRVPGYGKLSYSFRDLFSMDNEHPSPAGYSLVALLQQALLMEAGYELEGYEEFLENFPTNSEEREQYILFWIEKKFGDIVRKDPSFYRPSRMETEELQNLEVQIKSCDDLSDYQSLLPLLTDDVLNDLLEVVSSSKYEKGAFHHEKIGQLIESMDQVNDWEKVSSEFNEILLDWAEDYQNHQLEIARTMDLNFKAFGGVSNDGYAGGRFGVVRNYRGIVDVDVSRQIGDEESASLRLNIGAGLETNSLRLMGATQNITMDAGLRFGYSEDQGHSAEALLNGGITTKLGRIQYLQIFNEVKVGAHFQSEKFSLTDQVRFLFTISDDLTGRDNSTQAFYLGAENLSHFLDITPGKLTPTLFLGGNFTYAY